MLSRNERPSTGVSKYSYLAGMAQDFLGVRGRDLGVPNFFPDVTTLYGITVQYCTYQGTRDAAATVHTTVLLCPDAIISHLPPRVMPTPGSKYDSVCT